MSKAIQRPVFAALLCALLGGCSTAPRFDDHFGASVRANLSAQVIDPAAGANPNPATGIDGAAARATQDRYQRSFKAQDGAADQPLVGRNTQQ